MIDARIGAEVDTKYLNTIVPQLRQEEREKFKQFDISYKPNAALPVVNTISKPKLSKDEKQYANMAKLMGISIEQAKQIAAKQAQWIRKEVGADKEPCTCTATPGFCKFHRIGI
jgi:NADH:ubiquinone oxidoreductase subunit E